VRDERLRPGVWYRVVGRDLAKNLVTLKGPGGRRVTYSPSDHHAVDDVFRAERREFAVGDVVELKGKDRRLGLSPGQVGTVVSADRKGKALTVKTRGGATRRVELGRYKTLDHAYASTGHGAQSRTVDNVILLQTSGHRKEVVNRASLYVGASRTRGELHLVVDDLADVSRELTREHRKAAALDIVPFGKPALGLGLSLEPKE
jgi:ATP-dependent exoDNAse (exonuclease V) alpha subunit